MSEGRRSIAAKCPNQSQVFPVLSPGTMLYHLIVSFNIEVVLKKQSKLNSCSTRGHVFVVYFLKVTNKH